MGAIGRYEIESLIGKGAMGVVFLARDPNLGRQVALKTIEFPEGISEEMAQEFSERLLREAHAAAALSHPNIVTVHDVGLDPVRHFPYIVMEYVPGSSLKDLLDGQHRLAPELALRFGDSLADALVAAHKAGIIHRDIKPANILVRNTDGVVKITDFGVARLAASELTRTGAVVGSPAYMSPEQIRGAAVDARSDLFSLAVVLYEALTSKRPFGGQDLPSVAYSVAHETPTAVSRQVRGLPVALDAFFERALAKDPDDRFPDGTALRRALQQAGATMSDGVAMGTDARRDAPAGGPTRARRSRGTRARAEAGETVVEPEAMADMEDTPDEPGPAGTAAAGARRGRLLAHPVLVAIIVFFLMTVVAVPVLFANRKAHLKLEGRSGLEAGTLALRVDGGPVFERRLAAPHQDGLAPLFGRNQEGFEAWIDVRPGRHEIEAEVISEGEHESTRGSIVVDVSPGESRTLRVTIGRTFGRPVQIKVD